MNKSISIYPGGSLFPFRLVETCVDKGEGKGCLSIIFRFLAILSGENKLKTVFPLPTEVFLGIIGSRGEAEGIIKIMELALPFLGPADQSQEFL